MKSLNVAYRPRSFDEFVADKEMLESILSCIPDVHSYLFQGPRGCGKTTLSRLLAKEIGVDMEFDFFEINGASSTGIDSIRETVLKLVGFSPHGKVRMIVIDEAHMLSKNAQSAMLKVLEEPPDHTYFSLCTTNPEKLLDTIRSRCVKFTVKMLSDEQMKYLLNWVFEQEGIPDDLPDIQWEIVKKADGVPRDALLLYEKVKNIKDKTQAIRVIREGLVEEDMDVIFRALIMPGNAKNKFLDVQRVIKKIQVLDPETFRRSLLGYFSKAVLSEKNEEKLIHFVSIMSCFVQPVSTIGELLVYLFEACHEK